MKDGEKLIWAAAFSAGWMLQYQQWRDTGREISVNESVENAATVVTEARNAIGPVAESFGRDSNVFTMLEDMHRN